MIDHVLQAPGRATVSGATSHVLPSGFSAMRTARLHHPLQRHVAGGEVPGVVALVHHAGRVHLETLGMMAFGSDTPVRRNTIFRLASTTKPITAVAAMTLVEECRLRLDDPLGDPSLQVVRVLLQVRPDRLEHLMHRLMELLLSRILDVDALHEAREGVHHLLLLGGTGFGP